MKSQSWEAAQENPHPRHGQTKHKAQGAVKYDSPPNWGYACSCFFITLAFCARAKWITQKVLVGLRVWVRTMQVNLMERVAWTSRMFPRKWLLKNRNVGD